MHLRRGDSAKSGNYLARAEGKSGARIQRWLDPGWHTVEATNYHGGTTGPFTLNIKETRIRPGSAPSATGATLNLYGWDGSWHYRANTGASYILLRRAERELREPHRTLGGRHLHLHHL